MHASFMKFTLSTKASVFLVEHVFHFRGEYTAQFKKKVCDKVT